MCTTPGSRTSGEYRPRGGGSCAPGLRYEKAAKAQAMLRTMSRRDWAPQSVQCSPCSASSARRARSAVPKPKPTLRSSHPVMDRNTEIRSTSTSFSFSPAVWAGRVPSKPASQHAPPHFFVLGSRFPSERGSAKDTRNSVFAAKSLAARSFSARSRMNGWPVIGRPSLALPLRCTVHAVRQAAKRVCGMRRSPRQAADRAAKRGRRDEGADAMLV